MLAPKNRQNVLAQFIRDPEIVQGGREGGILGTFGRQPRAQFTVLGGHTQGFLEIGIPGVCSIGPETLQNEAGLFLIHGFV